jgi:hypothetical protein
MKTTDINAPTPIEEFKQLLKSHDWFFEYSDDMRVWRNGHNEKLQIQRITQLNPDLKALYDEYANWQFNKGKKPDWA